MDGFRRGLSRLVRFPPESLSTQLAAEIASATTHIILATMYFGLLLLTRCKMQTTVVGSAKSF